MSNEQKLYEEGTKIVTCPYCHGNNLADEYIVGRLIVKQKIRCQHCFEVFWERSDEE